MSSVLDLIDCPQCGYSEADYEHNFRTYREYTSCRRCGFYESSNPKRDADGKVIDWEHTLTNGAGALLYRHKDGSAFRGHFFQSDNEVLEAEEWLRERLVEGTIAPDSAYLTRWNPETKTIEMVVGTFFDWSGAEAVVSEKVDLRGFQLANSCYAANVEFSCIYIASATILLLEGQQAPRAGFVMHADHLCPACSVPTKSLVWENLALDGTDGVITPAFNYPHDLATAASLFYTAFPERQRKHPESIGFEFQLQGWSDDYIASGKWLCDCSGCRANPTQGCKRL